MSDVFHWLFAGCALTLLAAFMAAPLVLLILSIDTVFSRRIPARYLCWMWMLVAIRLLMPVAPESALSLQHVWQLIPSPLDVAKSNATEPQRVERVAREPQTMATKDVTFAAKHATTSAPPIATNFDWIEILLIGVSLLWLAGVAVVLLRAIVATTQFARRLRLLPSIDDPAVVNLLEQACRQIGLRHRPKMKYIADLSVPALFGVFRPTLCLPDPVTTSLSESQLRMIILHELMHLRRRDGYLSWLLTLVRAAHWFNPLAWLTIGRIEAYREQACDDAVRQLTVPDERRIYIDLLLQFSAASRIGTLNLIGLSFVRRTRRLAARMVAFENPAEVTSRVSRLAIGCVLALVAVAGLTDAASTGAQATDSESAEAHRTRARAASTQLVWAPGRSESKDDDFVEERTYDLSRALEMLARANPSADARRHVMAFLKAPLLKPQSIRLVDGDPDRLGVVMTRRAHASFSEILAGISHSGPWQISLEMKVLSPERIAVLGNVDWNEAIKFATPTAKSLPDWPDQSASAMPSQGKGLAVSIESLSWEYSPYLALVVDEEQMSRMIDRLQSHPRSNVLNSPKVTVFNGQRAHFIDEAQSPFVTGVQFVKGEFATAAQPEIAVLPEGARMDVQPTVVGAEALDLRCQLTLASIDGVRETKLPGHEIVVQNPRASRKTISARCQLAPGQTLLIAPFVGANDGTDAMFFVYAITANWFPD